MIDRSFQRSKHIGPRLTARHGNERILLWPAFSEARLKAVRPFGHLIGGDDTQQFLTGPLESEDGGSEQRSPLPESVDGALEAECALFRDRPERRRRPS